MKDKKHYFKTIHTYEFLYCVDFKIIKKLLITDLFILFYFIVKKMGFKSDFQYVVNHVCV